MYDQITHTKYGTTVTTRYSQYWGCWIAFDGPGDSTEAATAIGEGTTPEAARADFFDSLHGAENTARLIEPEGCENRWCLHDGCFVEYFDTREEAVASAEADEYIVNPIYRKRIA